MLCFLRSAVTWSQLWPCDRDRVTVSLWHRIARTPNQLFTAFFIFFRKQLLFHHIYFGIYLYPIVVHKHHVLNTAEKRFTGIHKSGNHEVEFSRNPPHLYLFIIECYGMNAILSCHLFSNPRPYMRGDCIEPCPYPSLGRFNTRPLQRGGLRVK